MTDEPIYNVSVKSGAGWRKHSAVRLIISVGQDYHEGHKLAAVVNWINRNSVASPLVDRKHGHVVSRDRNLERVHVSINGFLQRRRILGELLAEDPALDISVAREIASDRAVHEAVRWRQANGPILSGLKIPCELTEWKDWLDRPQFQRTHSAVLDLARRDPLFEEKLHIDARALPERMTKRGQLRHGSPTHSILLDEGLDHVTEELAVFAMQAAQQPAAEIYPGGNLVSADYLALNSISGASGFPPELQPLATRVFTRIDFNRVRTANDLRRASSAKLEA